LLAQEIIAFKQGVEGKNFVVLLNKNKKDIQTVLDQFSIRAEYIINWFAEDKILTVMGFSASTVVRLQREPKVTGYEGTS
jgi:hypothetical protein